MDINEIKDIVEENYSINIRSILKVKNSYNVKADEGEYCIKNIKYDLNILERKWMVKTSYFSY